MPATLQDPEEDEPLNSWRGTARPSAPTTTVTPAAISKVLQLGSQYRNLPRTRLDSSVGDLSKKELKRMLTFGIACVDAVFQSVCPNDPDTFKDLLNQNDGAQASLATADLLESISTMINALPRGSPESLTLKAAICGSFPQKAASEIIHRFSRKKAGSSDGACEMLAGVVDGAEEAEMGDAHPEVLMAGASQQASGLNGDAMESEPLESAFDNDEMSDIEDDEKSGAPRVTWRSYNRLGKNQSRLKAGYKHILLKRIVRRIDVEVLDHLLNFIFSAANAQLLAYGTRDLKVGDSVCTLPAVTRKKPKEMLYHEYRADSPPPTGKHVSRSTLFRIIKKVTAREQVNRRAVDYVVSVLVNEVVSSLTKVINISTAVGEERDALHKRLEEVNIFMKHGYKKGHVDTSGKSSSRSHCSHWALDGAPLEEESVECRACRMPWDFLEHLSLKIPADRDDAKEVVREAGKRFLLYFGHNHRVKVQQAALQDQLAQMKQGPMFHRVLIVMDWKMKFEPLWYRETMQAWFGKKGLSWHGAAVYYIYPDTDPANISAGDFSMLYLDQILENETCQDWCSVAAVTEAMLARVKKALPRVKEVILHSDNAGCYQNHLLPVLLPFLCKANGFRLHSYMHGETCDGKGPCDAHFSIGMSRVCSFCRQGNDVTTPRAVVVGLNSGGGIGNTIAELARTNRQSPALISWIQYAETHKADLKMIGRANEVQYAQVDGEEAFVLSIWAHSGIGELIKLRVSKSGISKMAAATELAPNSEVAQTSTLIEDDVNCENGNESDGS